MIRIRLNSPSPAPSAARGRQRGFTVVEVIIAIIVLTVGILGLMTTAALVTRMIATGQRAALATAFTAQVMEEQRLLATPIATAPCNPAMRVAGFRDLNRGSILVARVIWWWVQAPAPNLNSNTWQLKVATLRLSSAGRWKVDYTETSISCMQ